jgi:large subunit ribosomal protein L32
MPVPKRRTSRSRRRKRIASNSALTLPKLQKCESCDQLTRPHVVCPHCGMYRQRQILTVNAGM